MRRRHTQGAAAEIGDRRAAAILAGQALVEIRYLAGPVRREERDASLDDDLDRIRFLADLCHNLPAVAQPPARQPSRKNAPPSTRGRAMAERPMSWVWNTAGPQGRAWIQDQLNQAGHPWTPPPPLPTAQTGPPRLTVWQRTGLPERWPIQTPDGRLPLPRQARVLKALGTDDICALYEESGRLRLGLGTGGPWLRAHLTPNSTHYLVPDPADYYWPGHSDGRNGKIRWWQCTALLRMSDGEQVTSMIAVLPETFTALPSSLPRRQQLRLVHLARAIERDTYLWGRDHKAECSPQRCGFTPEPDDSAAVIG